VIDRGAPRPAGLKITGATGARSMHPQPDGRKGRDAITTMASPGPASLAKTGRGLRR
jgi:hypothetical protein